MKTTAGILSHAKTSKAKTAVLKTATLSPLMKILDENSMRGKDILGIAGMSKEEIRLVLDTAKVLKESLNDDAQVLLLKGKSLAMLFEKPSLRTRVTFELGMKQLGGHALFMEGPLGLREPVSDLAGNLALWVDGIMARTFLQETVCRLAEHADVPVINGLSDLEHPCQALADLLSIEESFGELAGLKIAYIGDPNNVSNSLVLAALQFGADCTIACPEQYMPDPEIYQQSLDMAAKHAGSLSLCHDPFEAAQDADVIYTDTWVSMGQEAEAVLKEKIFVPFQVNSKVLSVASAHAVVMHCLPAHRGQEISAEVIDGPQSIVLKQAENRLHVQKALLALCL